MAKKNLQIKEDKQLAFQEEQKNLDQIESRIRKIIADKSKFVESYRQQIKNITIIDDSDRQQKIRLQEQKKLEEQFLREYSSFVDSPYFGHMDMSDEDGDYSFFVGEKGIHEDGKAIVVDWRSPMGRTFYDKQKSAFVVEGIHYDLSLRRAVDIKKAKLISVNTEYDSINVSLDGEVIDPFLLSVLEDKRRDHKLTNIIRSIQQNQNEIIGLPLNESFIVQGCAGSGKTMILLHRLSFLAFNYPKTNFSRVCILTPNENFNIHINDLSVELGLDQIIKYTVESFYAGLINSRMRIDTSIKNGSSSSKISINAAQIESEKLLNDDMLKELYSNDFYDQVIAYYDDKVRKIVDSLNNKSVCKILRKNQYKIDNVKRMDFRSYSLLMNPIGALINRHEEAQNGAEAKEKELDKSKQLLVQLQKMAQKEEVTRTEKKDELISTVNETLKTLASNSDSQEKQLEQANIVVDEQLTKKNSLLAEISEEERSGDLTNRSVEEIIQSESLLLNFLETTNKGDCLVIYEQLRDLRSQLLKVPAYNFGKRRRLHGDISTLEGQLSSIVEEVKQNYSSSNGQKLDALRSQVDAIDKDLQESRAFINKVSGSLSKAKRQMEIYEKIRTRFEFESFPDFKKGLSPDDHDACEEIISAYETSNDRYYKLKKAITATQAKEKRLTEEVQKLKSALLDNTDYMVLKNAAADLHRFEFSVLYQDFQNKIRSVYKKYHVDYPNKIQYRHQVYLVLLLCTLYYGAASNTGYYLHIDEAQDLSVSEYRLLKMVLGDKTVFNIYGDVNQAIYNFKGIEDWEEIMSIIPSKLYFLNENYRNTIEITDYCNDVFGAEVTAIGLHGEKVKTLAFAEAMKTMEGLFNKSKPRLRTAIIYKRGLEGLSGAIKKAIKARCVFDKIEESMISVLTIEEAKGLEFDVVAVIKNNMTVNEEYIAYTRALDNLIITEMEKEDTGSFDMSKILDEIWS